MREIKFRVYDTKDKEMIYNSCIHFHHNGKVRKVEGKDPDKFPKFSRYIPLQFTGLKDKNGKEIYEGDIVSVEHYIAEIVFSDGCFCLSWKFGLTPLASDDYLDRLEVIGNTYENPELLSS